MASSNNELTDSSDMRVMKANSHSNPLHLIDNNELSAISGENLSFTCSKFSHLPQSTNKWAFNLSKSNVSQYYNTSESTSHGDCWSDQEKKQEMNHELMWIIFAEINNKDSNDKCLAGFVNFRFDIDDDIDVLYLYEIHLEPKFQARGIGSRLVKLLELIAEKTEMRKVILTSHKLNLASQNFFRIKLSYEDDITSHDPDDNASYDIISKIIVK